MQAIQSAFEFDDATLKKNRSGELSEPQRQKLNTYQRHVNTGFRGALFAFIITIAFICGAWALSDPMSRSTFRDEAIAFSIITAFIVAALIYSWITYSIQAKRLKPAEILHVEGTVSKKKQRFRRTSLFIYYLKVGKVKFRVDTAQKYEALREREYYRFHYIKYSPMHIILSVESIGDDS